MPSSRRPAYLALVPEPLSFDRDIEDALVPDEEAVADESIPPTYRTPSPAVAEASWRLATLARDAEREARRIKCEGDVAAIKGMLASIRDTGARLHAHLETVVPSTV
jgi:hypothetical protein